MNTFSKPIILRNLIPEDLRRYLTMVSHIYLRSNNIEFENMDGAHSCSHHNPWTDGLSVAILQRLREETKKNLEPTYGFLRVYNKYSTLSEHTDRESCEYSVTAFIDSCGTAEWPIKVNGESYNLKPGEGILYKGIDWKHSRDQFLGDWHAQCFLHYVDMDGPYKDFKYDRRKILGQSPTNIYNIGTQGVI